MSSFNLLSIGNQALQANQAALNTVGQNISNVNTPGYSRQVANFVSRENLAGSYINDIERIADDFMTRQVWSDTSNYSYYQKLESFANELDNLLASENSSISTAMNEYFGALQSAVDDPTSLPNRQLFLSQAGALENRIAGMYDSLTRQNESINVQLDSTVAQINSIVPRIAELNHQISKNTASDTVPNEVLDQRDLLIEQLSGFIDITTSVDSDGLVDIYVGEGQPLVIGTNSNRLVSIQGDPDPSKNDIALDIGSRPNVITDRIKGGSLGGLLEYRESNLANATNELGRVVMAFSETMNEQHQLGMDLDGDLGGLLFKDINAPELMASRVNGSSNNGGTIQQAKVEITDTSALKASSYTLIFNSNNNFTITRNQDGQLLNQNTFTDVTTGATDVDQDGEYFWNSSNNELTIQMDGFKLTLDGQTSFVGGDSYLIEPVRSGAFDFAVAMTDPRDLALASPLAGSSSIDNTGTGSIEVKVTDKTATTTSTMAPPVDVVISAGPNYTIHEQGNPGNVYASGSYVPGEAIELDGYEVTISNSPAVGDTFSVNLNTGGVSDNRNALAMSDLQFAKVVEGASYQGVYAKLVAQVGSETKVAQTNTQASLAVLNVSIDQRASVSGVNLDEEATKLIQYQQAYSASAKLISVSQTIFDTLLQSV